MLQQKLIFSEEFRIHTFGRDIIYGTTFIMNGHRMYAGCIAEKFVKMLLGSLPENFLHGTLIGWDIGITPENKLHVIEANITGFHEEFHRGFQTSGYFGDPEYGPIICAWLNKYFIDKYRHGISSIENSLYSTSPFFKEFMFYNSIIKSEFVKVLKGKINDIKTCAIVCIASTNTSLWLKLVDYFLAIGFAERYLLIVENEVSSSVLARFADNSFIKVKLVKNIKTSNNNNLPTEYDCKQLAEEYFHKIQDEECIIIY